MFYLLKFEKQVTRVEGVFNTYIEAEEVGQKECNGNFLVISKEKDLAQFNGAYLSSLKACLMGGDPAKRVRTPRKKLDPAMWKELKKHASN